MTYNPIKITILLFVLCFFIPGISFAQNNIEGMRFLTINALMQYGQKLYDRGNFSEASAVFNRVLFYDSHQAQALEYLKSMGHAPVSAIPVSPVLSSPVKQPVVSVNNTIVVRKSTTPIINAIDVWNTKSLKQAIEAKKKSIERLQIQIIQMRATLDVPSAENN